MTPLEAQIRTILDAASNDEGVEFKEEWVEEAGEQFKAALRKQFSPQTRDFRLRMSNIGRPLCQLQMEKSGAKKQRMPYNHVVRMLIGDSVETIVRFVMKAANVNVTSDGDKVVLETAGERIKGESDIDIDGKAYDIKSCSPWAFKNKWLKGYDEVRAKDDFGYVGQLYGYADAQDKDLGGWVVVDKSSGEVAVVEVQDTVSQQKAIRKQREDTVTAIVSDAPFRRCFEAAPEFYRKTPTGRKVLPKECRMCSFLHSCWPEARQEEKESSTARNKPLEWYVD